MSYEDRAMKITTDDYCKDCIGWGYFRRVSGTINEETSEWSHVEIEPCDRCGGSGKAE